MKKKKLVFVVVSILILVLLVVVIIKLVNFIKEYQNSELDNNSKLNNEKYVTIINNNGEVIKINNSIEFNSVKKYKDLEISNIQFSFQRNNSILLATVKNTSTSSKFNEELVKIIILGENDETASTIRASIPDLEPGEQSEINVIITADVVNAKNFVIKSK